MVFDELQVRTGVFQMSRYQHTWRQVYPRSPKNQELWKNICCHPQFEVEHPDLCIRNQTGPHPAKYTQFNHLVVSSTDLLCKLCKHRSYFITWPLDGYIWCDIDHYISQCIFPYLWSHPRRGANNCHQCSMLKTLCRSKITDLKQKYSSV